MCLCVCVHKMIFLYLVVMLLTDTCPTSYYKQGVSITEGLKLVFMFFCNIELEMYGQSDISVGVVRWF